MCAQEIMRHIYSAIYVECVVKDPLYEPGAPFENANFTSALNNVRPHEEAERIEWRSLRLASSSTV